MSKLTDLEICTEIANINGDSVSKVGQNHLIKDDIAFGTLVNAASEFAACKTVESYKVAEKRFKDYLYNPLTDDALCFRLMVKYEICVEPADCNAFSLDYETQEACWEVTHEENLNRAICLAIIKANERTGIT